MNFLIELKNSVLLNLTFLVAIFSPNYYEDFKGLESKILFDFLFQVRRDHSLYLVSNPRVKFAFRATQTTRRSITISYYFIIFLLFSMNFFSKESIFEIFYGDLYFKYIYNLAFIILRNIMY